MPRGPCSRGCKPLPGAKARYHDSEKQCPYSPIYNPNAKGAIDKNGNPVNRGPEPAEEAGQPSSGSSSAEAQAQPAPSPNPTPAPVPKAPGTSRLTFSPTPAEVVPVKRIIRPVEPADYVVDGPHTKTAFGLVFGATYQLHVWVDEYYEWTAHLPKSQFALSDLALLTIDNDPRNLYSRMVTRACMAVGCRTQQQAHAAITTVEFFFGFGGVVVALVMHYRKVLKESPRAIRNREKKKVAAEAKRRALTVPGRTLSEGPAPEGATA